MGKDKSRTGMKRGGRKKTFLDNQKRARNDARVSKKTKGDPNVLEEAPRKAFKFENFSDQVANVDSSIVYQLAGKVLLPSPGLPPFLSTIVAQELVGSLWTRPPPPVSSLRPSSTGGISTSPPNSAPQTRSWPSMSAFRWSCSASRISWRCSVVT